MDEIAVSFFLIGRDNTLPLEIWGRLRRGITPEINAVSTIIFVFFSGGDRVWYRLRERGENPERTVTREIVADLAGRASCIKREQNI
jgi:spermidine/putrescine transport system permease protein